MIEGSDLKLEKILDMVVLSPEIVLCGAEIGTGMGILVWGALALRLRPRLTEAIEWERRDTSGLTRL
jgi:hypothetical protein